MLKTPKCLTPIKISLNPQSVYLMTFLTFLLGCRRYRKPSHSIPPPQSLPSTLPYLQPLPPVHGLCSSSRPGRKTCSYPHFFSLAISNPLGNLPPSKYRQAKGGWGCLTTWTKTISMMYVKVTKGQMSWEPKAPIWNNKQGSTGNRLPSYYEDTKARQKRALAG